MFKTKNVYLLFLLDTVVRMSSGLPLPQKDPPSKNLIQPAMDLITNGRPFPTNCFLHLVSFGKNSWLPIHPDSPVIIDATDVDPTSRQKGPVPNVWSMIEGRLRRASSALKLGNSCLLTVLLTRRVYTLTEQSFRHYLTTVITQDYTFGVIPESVQKKVVAYAWLQHRRFFPETLLILQIEARKIEKHEFKDIPQSLLLRMDHLPIVIAVAPALVEPSVVVQSMFTSWYSGGGMKVHSFDCSSSGTNCYHNFRESFEQVVDHGANVYWEDASHIPVMKADRMGFEPPPWTNACPFTLAQTISCSKRPYHSLVNFTFQGLNSSLLHRDDNPRDYTTPRIYVRGSGPRPGDRVGQVAIEVVTVDYEPNFRFITSDGVNGGDGGEAQVDFSPLISPLPTPVWALTFGSAVLASISLAGMQEKGKVIRAFAAWLLSTLQTLVGQPDLSAYHAPQSRVQRRIQKFILLLWLIASFFVSNFYNSGYKASYIWGLRPEQ